VGLEGVKATIEDPEQRHALYERFRHSQRSAQIDPWAQRVAGRDHDEFNPMTRRMEFLPA
jgi:nitrite reductase (NADH) large subunit